jgi:hypothetical protein
VIDHRFHGQVQTARRCSPRLEQEDYCVFSLPSNHRQNVEIKTVAFNPSATEIRGEVMEKKTPLTVAEIEAEIASLTATANAMSMKRAGRILQKVARLTKQLYSLQNSPA